MIKYSKLYDLSLRRVRSDIIKRCYNPQSHAFINYGARGVRVCQEWLDNPESFYKWALQNGWKKGLHVDKDIKGNDLLYSPETCSIVTQAENNAAKRNKPQRNVAKFKFKGEMLTIREISNKVGISADTIRERMKQNNLSPEKCIYPVKDKLNNSLLLLCKQNGIEYHVAYNRIIREKCNVAQALRPFGTKKKSY